MELVNHTVSKNTSISEPLQIVNFRREWNEILSSIPRAETHEKKKEVHETVASRLNMNPQSKEFQTLRQTCSAAKLKCDGVDIEILDHRSIPQTVNAFKTPPKSSNEPKQADLSCVRFQKKHLEKGLKSATFRIKRRVVFHRHFVPEQSTICHFNKTVIGDVKVAENEVILMVQVYRPTKYGRGQPSKIFDSVDQVLAVLGCQKLTALRQAIKCNSDHFVPGDFSENPNSPKRKAKDIYKSGIFYIDGTIYEDGNDGETGNYARTLVDWALQHNLGPFQVKPMEKAKFFELKIQLGYPYLYMHQGDCEHIILFSDMRLMNPEDCPFLSVYPFSCRRTERKRKACMICSTHTAKWMSCGNKRLSQDPYFFCDACFKSFNYTKEGKKIGEFEAYVYVDPTVL